jgi:hypothetical protein
MSLSESSLKAIEHVKTCATSRTYQDEYLYKGDDLLPLSYLSRDQRCMIIRQIKIYIMDHFNNHYHVIWHEAADDNQAEQAFKDVTITLSEKWSGFLVPTKETRLNIA